MRPSIPSRVSTIIIFMIRMEWFTMRKTRRSTTGIGCCIWGNRIFYLSSRMSFTTSIFLLSFFHTLRVISSPGNLSLMTSRRVTPFQSDIPATSVIISPLSSPDFSAGEFATTASGESIIRSHAAIERLRLLAISPVNCVVCTPTKARLIIPFFSTECMR